MYTGYALLPLTSSPFACTPSPEHFVKYAYSSCHHSRVFVGALFVAPLVLVAMIFRVAFSFCVVYCYIHVLSSFWS